MVATKKINIPSIRRRKGALAVLMAGTMVAAATVGAGAVLAGPADAAGGSCTVTLKPGTEIADAVNAQGNNAIICLTDGVFKVAKTIAPKADQTLRGSKGTVLDGSVPLAGWAQNGGRWQVKGMLPAAYSGAGVCEDLAANNCNQAEDLFLNGKRMVPAASLSAVNANSYFADYDTNTITIGRDPGKDQISMAKTRTAISSRAAGVHVEGVTVTRFANRSQQGAVVVSGSNWTVTGSTIVDNHAIGLMMTQGPNATIKGNTINANGQLGIGQHKSNGVVIEGNNIAGNNTAGYWIADWESGGIKITFSSSTVRNNSISDNLGVGVWADVEADGVIIDANQINGNASDGVRYEISRNGTITNNSVTGNGLGMKRGGGTGLMSGSGIDVNTSSNVKIVNNTVEGNLNGIGLQARNRGTGPWGVWTLADVLVKGNSVDLTGTSPVTATTGVIQAGDRIFDTAKAGIKFQDNSYVVSAESKKLFNLGRNMAAFGSWQSVGHDVAGKVSTTASAPAPTVKPSPAPTVNPSPTPTVNPSPTAPPVNTRIVASDKFSAPIAKGAGTASIGGVWTVLGAPSNYSVSNGAANIKMAAPGYLPGMSLKSVNAKNADTTVSFSLDKNPTGAGVYASLIGRSVANVGDYRAKIQLSSKGTVLSLVRTNAAGVETMLTQDVFVSKVAVKAGDVVNVRLKISGADASTIQSKVWLGAASQSEAWQATATDRTAAMQKPGSVGILASLSGSAVNAPVTLRLHEIESVESI